MTAPFPVLLTALNHATFYNNIQPIPCSIPFPQHRIQEEAESHGLRAEWIDTMEKGITFTPALWRRKAASYKLKSQKCSKSQLDHQATGDCRSGAFTVQCPMDLRPLIESFGPGPAKMSDTKEITLHVRRLEDIFFQSAILLFPKRLLNREIVQYIVEAADTIPEKTGIRLSIHVVEKEHSREQEARKLIHKHFAYGSERTRSRVKSTLKLAFRSMLLGTVFLVIMLSVASAITAFSPESSLMSTIRELFVILGWVALWRPAELLLYEWRPYQKKAKLFRRLAESNIEFV